MLRQVVSFLATVLANLQADPEFGRSYSREWILVQDEADNFLRSEERETKLEQAVDCIQGKKPLTDGGKTLSVQRGPHGDGHYCAPAGLVRGPSLTCQPETRAFVHCSHAPDGSSRVFEFTLKAGMSHSYLCVHTSALKNNIMQELASDSQKFPVTYKTETGRMPSGIACLHMTNSF